MSSSAGAIHPTAIVSPGAKLGDGVKIGPYCTVDEGVTLHDGAELLSHAVVTGRTKIGPGTRIYPFASVGHRPQDLKYKGEPSRLEIGARCVIREHVTLNPGTEEGGMVTRVGDDCLLMVGVHVAHDCTLGDNVILSNNVVLAGHVALGDYVIIGGQSGVHQFCRIGEHAFVGGQTGIAGDVIPFGMAVNSPAKLAGLNMVGLKRRGFARRDIVALRRAYQAIFFDEGTLDDRLASAAERFSGNKHVQLIVDFLHGASERPVCLPEPGRSGR